LSVGQEARMLDLEEELARVKASGRKILVGYLTAGAVEDWTEYARAVIDGGADALEVGVPFSDPVLDGPVIQRACEMALSRGARPLELLDQAASLSEEAPLAAMTYANLAHSMGFGGFAQALHARGITGCILADLPFEEAVAVAGAFEDASVALVQLVAPTTSEERLARIARATRGFLYCVAVMGVTGERGGLAESAIALAGRALRYSPRPVLVGVGVSTPESAALASATADGVVVGSPLVRMMLEGRKPSELEAYVKAMRAAIGG
jgi:tryptophan synthase alpha chain